MLIVAVAAGTACPASNVLRMSLFLAAFRLTVQSDVALAFAAPETAYLAVVRSHRERRQHSHRPPDTVRAFDINICCQPFSSSQFQKKSDFQQDIGGG